MTVRCDYADVCPIVKYFSEQSWKIMLTRYCYGVISRCHRYQLRQNGHETVPQHIMPWDGDDDGSAR